MHCNLLSSNIFIPHYVNTMTPDTKFCNCPLRLAPIFIVSLTRLMPSHNAELPVSYFFIAESNWWYSQVGKLKQVSEQHAPGFVMTQGWPLGVHLGAGGVFGGFFGWSLSSDGHLPPLTAMARNITRQMACISNRIVGMSSGFLDTYHRWKNESSFMPQYRRRSHTPDSLM